MIRGQCHWQACGTQYGETTQSLKAPLRERQPSTTHFRYKCLNECNGFAL